jgi:hypothetical protein
MVSVYGKLSDEKMEGILNDLQMRPHTSALLKDQKADRNTSEPFYEDKGNAQEFLKVGEDSFENNDTGIKKKDDPKEIERKMLELEKKLKKIQKENDRLKQTSTRDGKGASC